ncbi:MAG: hypothetical protein Q9215_006841 [Flavoplaca cf. flavocitrina]
MSSNSIHLVLDFDGTLTTSSSLSLIYDIGHRLNPSCPSWQSISQAYVDDFNSMKTTSMVKPTTLLQALQRLESLRAIEYRSIARVEATKVFRGVNIEILHAAAEKAIRDAELEMRDGWQKLVGMVMKEEGKVGVVSVGWSGDFIRSCLHASLERVRAAEQDSDWANRVDLPLIDVRANNIIGGDEGKMDRYWRAATSDDKSQILTAEDKLRVMKDILGMDVVEGSHPLVVYVGDSTTDLECLLHADVGICLRDEAASMTWEQRELQEILDQAGIDCRWVGNMDEGDLEMPPLRSIDGGVYHSQTWWARDFDEISQSLLFRELKSMSQTARQTQQ